MGRKGRPFSTTPTRCPSCRPIARKVTDARGRRLTWLPEATYVGFLRTDGYEGYKRAPDACPTCGSELVEVER